jgi:lysozyme family protein
MSNLIRSAAAGFALGGALGQRYAENKFRKQAAGIEADYLAGKIKDDQLDRLLQDLAVETGTHRRGLSTSADTSTSLRARRVGALTRQSAQSAASGDREGTFRFAGDAAGIAGDPGAADSAYRGGQIARAYSEGPDGRPNIARQALVTSQEAAKSGQLTDAVAAQGFSDDQRLQMQNVYAGQILQRLPAAMPGGVVDDAKMQELEVEMQAFAQAFDSRVSRVMYNAEDDAFHVFDNAGKPITYYPAASVGEAVVAAGGDPTKLVEQIRAVQSADAAADAEGARTRGEENAKFLRSGLLELYKGDSAKAQLVTAAANAASAAGIDVSKMEPMDDGTYKVNVAGQLLKLTPNPNPTLENPQEWTLVDQNGVAVDPAVLQSKQAQAAIGFVTAQAQANADLSAEDRIAKAQELFQLYGMLEGKAPVGSALPTRRGGGGGSATQSTSAPAGVPQDFESTADLVLEIEGGYVADDAGAGPTNHGINSRANPDIDVRGLTEASAKVLYKERYWDAIDADQLPPNLRAIAFDAAFNQGVSNARRWIKESGGDPAEFLRLRAEHYDHLITANPEKYGQYANGWRARLERFAGVLPSGSGYAQGPATRGGPRRPQAGALAQQAPSNAYQAGAQARALGGAALDRAAALGRSSPRVAATPMGPAGPSPDWEAVTDFLTGLSAGPAQPASR